MLLYLLIPDIHMSDVITFNSPVVVCWSVASSLLAAHVVEGAIPSVLNRGGMNMLYYTENHEVCGCELCHDKDAEVSCIEDMVFLCDKCEIRWNEEEWKANPFGGRMKVFQ